MVKEVKLPRAGVVLVHTRNTLYTVVLRGDGKGVIQGHPEYCPNFTPFRSIEIYGSRGIGRMWIEFDPPHEDGAMITSPVVEIEVLHTFPTEVRV